MANSMCGKILVVDLTERTISDESINPEWARSYVGGAGYGARRLLEDLDPGLDTLAPENPLLFMTGPVTGLDFAGVGRFEICGRSPLTGIWAETSVGGYFGSELKFAGYDGILVKGASATPVIISVNDEGAEILDAGEYWGKDAFQAEDMLKQQLDEDKLQVVSIGQAGENCVPLACVVHKRGHIAARSGLGALMGSKKLKAIGVRGTKAVSAADPERLAVERKAFMEKLNAGDHWFGNLLREHGTNGGMEFCASIKDVPMKNWQVDDREDIAKSNSNSAIEEKYGLKSGTCFRCPIACKRLVNIPDGRFKTDGIVPSPEYESAAALGPMTLLDETGALVFANDLCNRYGLDTISAGSVIAFAMECKERGLLSEYLEGESSSYLEWGDVETIIRLCEDMAFARGLGKILGYGSKRAAEIIGNGAEEIAIHSKGLEAPMHHPKADTGGRALAYATSPRGACHLHGSGNPQKTGDELIASLIHAQNLAGVAGSSVMCNYVNMFVPEESMAAFLTAATGDQWTIDDLVAAGERIWKVKRVFNLLCGLKKEDDNLSRRVIDAVPDYDFAASLEEYYKQRSLDADAVPAKEHMEELNIGDVYNMYIERRG